MYRIDNANANNIVKFNNTSTITNNLFLKPVDVNEIGIHINMTLVYICNACLSNCTFPRVFKNTVVVLIHKGNNL